jgi:phenylacetate-CoA ligase
VDFLRSSPLLAGLAAMSRTELQALQLAKIRAQMARLWEASPFYRARWQAAGIRPGDITSLDDFRRLVPTVNKQDFLQDQADHPPFGGRLGIRREDVALVSMTGGTSGQGQEVYGRSQADIAVQGHLHFLPWFMAGLRPGHLALNCVPAGGLTTGGWGPSEGFRLAGATAFHAGGTLSTEAKIDLLLRFGELHFIYASTNYLHTLTQAFLRRGIVPAERFPMLAGIQIAAEGYPAEWARETQKLWGCALHEGYGSTQGAGFVATTCDQGIVREDRERGLMRILEWLNYAEVIDPDTGRHVAPGEEGEIVLTNLDIEGSPVIRFATRDKARWFPPEYCGGGLPWGGIEAGSIGRYDDMMKVRGNNIWPLAVDTVVFAAPEVAEYVGRVYVDDEGRTEVELRLALKPGACDEAARPALFDALRATLKARTNVWMQIREVPLAELPQFTYKARRWTDERKAGYRPGAAS